MFTDSVPVPVPDAGLRLSQLVFSVAVQLSMPLPELVMDSVLAAGEGPPCVAVNASEVTLSPIVGVGAAVMSNVTVTVCGEEAAPGPTSVIRPLRDPTVSPLGLTEMVIAPEVEPVTADVPFSSNQALFDDAVHTNGPVPTVAMVRGCVAGAGPFWIAANDRAVGLRMRVGVVVGGEGVAISWAVPGISASKRLRLGGAAVAGAELVAAAVRVEGAALPTCAEDVRVGPATGGVCPIRGLGNGAANGGVAVDLLENESVWRFCMERPSRGCTVGAVDRLAELIPEVGSSDAVGCGTAIAVAERRISVWGFFTAGAIDLGALGAFV